MGTIKPDTNDTMKGKGSRKEKGKSAAKNNGDLLANHDVDIDQGDKNQLDIFSYPSFGSARISESHLDPVILHASNKEQLRSKP